MLRIRFFKVGRKGQPFYKIVVTDKNNAPAGGRFIDEIGFYNPLTKEFSIKEEKVSEWRDKGAQCSDTVRNLLIKKGIIKGKKANVFSLSERKKKEIEDKKEKEKVERENKEKEEAKKEEVTDKKEEETEKEEVIEKKEEDDSQEAKKANDEK